MIMISHELCGDDSIRLINEGYTVNKIGRDYPRERNINRTFLRTREWKSIGS